MVFEMYSNRCRKCSKTIKPYRNLGSLCKKKIFWNVLILIFIYTGKAIKIKLSFAMTASFLRIQYNIKQKLLKV